MSSFVNIPLLATIVVVILIIVALVINNWIAKNRYFICPNCQKKFKVSLKELTLAPHCFDEDYIKCPYCGKKEYMREIKEK